MFELGALALSRAVETGVLRGGWELHGIGTVEAARPTRARRRRRPRAAPAPRPGGYAELLREHDVGLALMYTPHPSLVPIEMAAAGMLTVTNSFENKTAEAMAAISPNLIAVRAQPSTASWPALARPSAGVGRLRARARAAADVSWSRDWDESFDDELMERVELLLDALIARRRPPMRSPAAMSARPSERDRDAHDHAGGAIGEADLVAARRDRHRTEGRVRRPDRRLAPVDLGSPARIEGVQQHQLAGARLLARRP